MFSLTAVNDLHAWEKLGASLRHHAAEEGMSEKLQHELAIVVEELFVNFVHHGAADIGTFTVEVEKTDTGASVRVADDGAPFDPLSYSEADVEASLDERQAGGLVLHLVRQLANSLTYQRSGNQNVIELELIN